jgi:hypothetical protein
MRVLLSDGSGLTARQCATQLAAAGHTVEVLSSDPFGLCRFTRHVRRGPQSPPLWCRSVRMAGCGAGRVAGARPFDVLLPTQEQVAVVACSLPRFHAAGVGTAVPSIAALARVQDKVTAHQTLAELEMPQPDATVVSSRDELAGCQRWPAFVKRPIGTAMSGVHLVSPQRLSWPPSRINGTPRECSPKAGCWFSRPRRVDW